MNTNHRVGKLMTCRAVGDADAERIDLAVLKCQADIGVRALVERKPHALSKRARHHRMNLVRPDQGLNPRRDLRYRRARLNELHGSVTRPDGGLQDWIILAC